MDEQQSLFDQNLEKEIEYLGTLKKGSEEHTRQLKLVNELQKTSNENKRIDSDYWRAERKNEADKTINDEKLKMEKEQHEAELAVKKSEIKANKIRTWSDLGKGVATLGVFALFEYLAHKRDMEDVLGNDPTHVQKNPLKLKFF